jgi:hypothetical protein
MDHDDTLACGRLVACDTLVGRPRMPQPDFEATVSDLLSEMTRLDIAAAVVRHRACQELSGHLGNDVLMEEIAGHDNLIPAWFVTSDGREPHYDPAHTLADMLAAGGRVAWTDPTLEWFSLAPWCSGKLYAVLAERRVPLLLPYERISLTELHEAMTAYPELRVVLYEVPRIGRVRNLYPLLELHPNLHVILGPVFSVHAGPRDLCSHFGPHRWLWGCRYPESESGAGITGLMYAGLSEDEMAAIGHGNLERLLAEVVL